MSPHSKGLMGLKSGLGGTGSFVTVHRSFVLRTNWNSYTRANSTGTRTLLFPATDSNALHHGTPRNR